MPRKKAGPHTVSKPLNTGLIERCLDALGVVHSRDRYGDIYTIIPSSDGGSGLLCWFLVEGALFQLVCTLTPQSLKVPQCQWPTATRVCNAFHDTCRFGRGVLRIREGQDEATLVFEAAIACTDGVSEAFLQEFIVSHVASACMFFDMVHKEKVLSASIKQREEPQLYISCASAEA